MSGTAALIDVIGFENLTAGMGTSAYAAYMASVTKRQFSSTQYTLLSSLMAIPGTIFAGRTGARVEGMGWNWFFFASALAAQPGLFLIRPISGVKLSAVEKGICYVLIAVTIVGGVYAIGINFMDIFKLFMPAAPKA